MKKHLAVLAATAVLGVTSAFAANPFFDVTPQDWAYQAVAQLAAQGVVNGYPDGTFQGQTNITRFEMAQMVAKAMARQGQVDAEQNAIINRLHIGKQSRQLQIHWRCSYALQTIRWGCV